VNESVASAYEINVMNSVCMCVPLDDPGERRRSLSTMVGEDTDMRPHMWDDVNDINVNMIMQEADEQLKNGTISFSHYNTVLKQVSMIQVLVSSSLFQWVPGTLSPGVKQPECNAYNLSPPSAEVRNEWNYTCTPSRAFMACAERALPVAVSNLYRKFLYKQIYHLDSILFLSSVLVVFNLISHVIWSAGF
jgi:hypothetical protein